LKIKVGYSDHSLGIEVPIAAVALGAGVIEKHFTLDKNMVGPDHKASLEPQSSNKWCWPSAILRPLGQRPKAQHGGWPTPFV